MVIPFVKWIIRRLLPASAFFSAPVIAQEEPATSLSALHDIVEPAPVPFWPPAPGVYVLVFLLALLLLGIAWSWVRRWRANRYRRAALAELEIIRRDPSAWSRMSALVKRVALAAWPRREVAASTGRPWWRFVDQGVKGTPFDDSEGALLDRLAWSVQAGEEASPGEVDVAATAVESWIQSHDASRSSADA